MKQQVVTIRMETEEKARVEVEAKKLGISVSAFIRLLIKQWSNGIRFERREDLVEVRGEK